MMIRNLASTLLISCALVLHTAACAWTAGNTDPARFRLTPALMDRMDAVATELKGMPSLQEGNESEDPQTVEELARKLDAHPRVRAALARQKLSSREYSTAMLAALHAGMVLAVEKGADQKALQGFTPEQRANVDVLRARMKARP